MRVHAVDLHVLAEGGFRFDRVIVRARWNGESRVGDQSGADLALRRLLGEDEPEPRAVAPRLPVGRVVHLEDQRRSGWNPLSRPGHVNRRVFTDGPVHEHRIAAARRSSSTLGRARGRPRCQRRGRCCNTLGGWRLCRRCGVDDRPNGDDVGSNRSCGFTYVNDDVVDVGAITGAHLAGLHPAILREVRRHLEVLVGDLAGDRHLEFLRHLEHGVGRSDLPALRELRQRRQRGAIAFTCSAVRPADDRVDLAVAQAQVVAERAVRRVGVPRRHRTRADLLPDRASPGARIGVGEQRHRRDLARTMAARALVEHDRRDVAAEGRRAGIGGCRPVLLCRLR